MSHFYDLMGIYIVEHSCTSITPNVVRIPHYIAVQQRRIHCVQHDASASEIRRLLLVSSVSLDLGADHPRCYLQQQPRLLSREVCRVQQAYEVFLALNSVLHNSEPRSNEGRHGGCAPAHGLTRACTCRCAVGMSRYTVGYHGRHPVHCHGVHRAVNHRRTPLSDGGA